MSGDKKNEIDWQSELKARLEAYEKRTGRRISGRKDPEGILNDEGILDPISEFGGEAADSLEPGGVENLGSSMEIEVPDESFHPEDDEDNQEEDYQVGPDFLAVLDGMDEDDEMDSFLFRERLSRDTDPDGDLDLAVPVGNGGLSAEDEDSYFDGMGQDNEEEEEFYPDPVVKVVNIEEFRMDSSAEGVFVPLKDDSPLGNEDAYEPAEDEEVSKEIIVSRLLSGTIDMLIAVIIAAGFMEIAAWKLSLNFFEVGVLKWIGILAVLFYILNCLYFLTLAQRTPGMLLTELKLSPGKGRTSLSFMAILIRTLAFFPSALCVTGLVWSFFDYQARCLHDIVSGTRVISSRS